MATENRPLVSVYLNEGTGVWEVDDQAVMRGREDVHYEREHPDLGEAFPAMVRWRQWTGERPVRIEPASGVGYILATDLEGANT